MILEYSVKGGVVTAGAVYHDGYLAELLGALPPGTLQATQKNANADGDYKSLGIDGLPL